MKSDHINQHVLDQLHSDFQLPSLSGEEIKDLKIDETSVFYWVTIMKDKLCEQYRRNKPYFNNKFKYKNIPFNLLISISEMIPYWVDQIDLVLIHITCKPVDSKHLSYFNGRQWVRCNRTFDMYHQPVCLPQ
jgi:hypothetical protein